MIMLVPASVRYVGLALFAVLAPAWAAAPPMSLGPHEHGVGQLNAMLDGSELKLELLAPAADIVGFEHPPVTVKERMAVRRVAAQLARGDHLFVLPAAAGCTLTAAEVDGEQMETGGQGHHHDHGHTAPQSGPHVHAEFHATYGFRCTAPQALTGVEVKVFDAFNRLTRLRFNLSRQGKLRKGDLTPGAPRLPLGE